MVYSKLYWIIGVDQGD